MIPNASEASWRQPVRARPHLALKVALAAVAGVLSFAYLAGVLFLWSIHVDPRHATPLTLLQ